MAYVYVWHMYKHLLSVRLSINSVKKRKLVGSSMKKGSKIHQNELCSDVQ